MTESHPMTDGLRRTLLGAAELIAVIAAVGNFGHVYDYFTDRGGQDALQGAVGAALPDVLLILCVIKLRFSRGSVPAWFGLAFSVTVVGWASLDLGTDWFATKATALWPIVAAILAACLIEPKAVVADIPADIRVDTPLDMAPDTVPDIQVDTMSTPDPVHMSTRDGVVDIAGRKPSMDSLIAKVRAKEITQAEAARRAGVNVKTIQRRINPPAKQAAR